VGPTGSEGPGAQPGMGLGGLQLPPPKQTKYFALLGVGLCFLLDCLKKINGPKTSGSISHYLGYCYLIINHQFNLNIILSLKSPLQAELFFSLRNILVQTSADISPPPTPPQTKNRGFVPVKAPHQNVVM